MRPSRYFTITFGGARPLKVDAEKHDQRASRQQTQLLLDGLVYAVKGEPPLPAHGRAAALLDAYLREPRDFFERVDGQCTITIITPAGLRCFRSALASAQIFYSAATLSNRLLFAAESLDRVERDPDYFLEFLLDRRAVHFSSPLTPITGVQRLLPGTCLTIDASGHATTAVVTPQPKYFYGKGNGQKIDEAAAAFRAVLESAIDSRLSARNAPAACELSGGLDSSFVAALVATKASSVSAVMYSYSKFPSHKFSEECARAVAHEFGIKLTVLDLLDLPKSDLTTGQPYSDEPTDFFWQGALFGAPTRAVLPENAALFGGFGADQLLMRDPIVASWLLHKGEVRKALRLISDTARDSERSRAHLLWQSSLMLLPRPVYLKLSGAFAKRKFNPFALQEMDPNSLLLGSVPWLQGRAAERLFETSDRDVANIAEGRIRLDFSYLVSPSLTSDPYYEERGVVSAHPFCDSRVIQHALAEIDWELIHDWKHPYKHLLREAQRGLVPEQVRTRTTNEFFFNGFLALVLKTNQNYLRELIQDFKPPGELELAKAGMHKTFEEMLFGLSDNTGGKLLNVLGYELWWRAFQTATTGVSAKT